MRRRVVASLGMPALLAACAGKELMPPDAVAVNEINNALLSRTVSIFYPAHEEACARNFIIGPVQVIDMRGDGATAVVKASARVEATTFVGRDSILANRCYGSLSTDWQKGMSATYVHEYQFERWRSGWHLAKEP